VQPKTGRGTALLAPCLATTPISTRFSSNFVELRNTALRYRRQLAGRPRRISARQSDTGNRLDPCARNAPPQRVHRNVHWFCMFLSRRPSSASSRRLKRCARSLPRACDQGSVRLADLPKRKCGRSLRHAASSSAPARSRRNLTKSRSLAGLSARYSLPTTHFCFSLKHDDAPPATLGDVAERACRLQERRSLQIARSTIPVRDPPAGEPAWRPGRRLSARPVAPCSR
jgi:hypothetical protein